MYVCMYVHMPAHIKKKNKFLSEIGSVQNNTFKTKTKKMNTHIVQLDITFFIKI